MSCQNCGKSYNRKAVTNDRSTTVRIVKGDEIKELNMDKAQEEMALKQMERGDPRDLIRLIEYEISRLENEYKTVGCKGCGGSSYTTKIEFLKQKIRFIKSQKKFRRLQL